MSWELEFDRRAIRELKKLSPNAKQEILGYLESRIATDEDPRRFGKELKANLSGLWRYRVGDYRIICRIIDNKLVVIVIAVGHRRDVYKWFSNLILPPFTCMKLLKCFPLLLLPFLLSAKEKHTNFVIFLTDDMGWGDLACYGHPVIQTPNLDKFAQEGMKYEQCYSACGVCSPSRSSILTGRTPYRNGVWRWIPSGHYAHLRESEVTAPELLKVAGYDTCHVGKWHLNGKFNSDEQPQPDDHGYNYWIATQNNAAPNHKNPTNFVRNGEPVGRMEGYSAPLMADEAIHWLETKRDKDKPFYLSVWTHEPHLPIESDPKFMELYKEFEDEGIRQHHGNITQIDHAFGNLMKALDKMGLAEDTFVFFTSDNGPEGNGTNGRTRGSTGGLRDRKRSSHEGGIRVPGIVRWPGKVEAGSTNRTPVIGSDLFSTVLDVAGIPLPSDRTIDGVSILPTFEGKGLQRCVPLYWRNHLARANIHVALRDGDWKILGSHDLQEFQLYKIETDWQEKEEVSEKYPEVFARLKAKLIEVHEQVEEEGPNEWWENEPVRKRGKPKKAGPLSKGKDTTGDFAVVKGGTASKSDMGYSLETSGEAVALMKLDNPATQKATFKLSYKTDTSSTTKNATFAFGPSPENDNLLKAGTAIGMGNHVFFQGGWGNLNTGPSTKMKSGETAIIEVQITADLKKGKATLETDGKKLTVDLPKEWKEINYYGYYAKATKSSFSKVEVIEAE